MAMSFFLTVGDNTYTDNEIGFAIDKSQVLIPMKRLFLQPHQYASIIVSHFCSHPLDHCILVDKFLFTGTGDNIKPKCPKSRKNKIAHNKSVTKIANF